MKIGILSRAPRAYSTRRLREAAKARGHTVRVLDTLSFAIHVEQRIPSLTLRTAAFHPTDAIVPRIGASITQFGTAVVRQFEQMGVFCLNSSRAITVSRDKLRALQILSRHNIGIPASAFVRRKEDVLPAIEKVGGAPVIIKLLEGTQGVGVILADTPSMASAIIETLQSTRHNVLIQRFVSESRGKDIRAIVAGDRVVAAMRRRARGQEFRSNVHRGGSTEAVDLDETYTGTAIRAARILGLLVAGVDMLETRDGPQVMEVNSSPGLEGIETATGADVAGAMIECLEELAHFQGFDLEGRLSLAHGYEVAEITVGPGSQLAHKKLVETGLRSHDIVVLNIDRQGLAIPNPSSSREILPGDVLLCFGKRITLKTFLPGIRGGMSRGKKRKKKERAARREGA